MERQDGILWRLARLHPGWVTLIVWTGYAFLTVAHWMVNLAHQASAAAAFSGFMLFYMGYPLFALLYLPGRFRSKSRRRPESALAAFFALWVFVGAAMAAGEDNMGALLGAADAGEVAAVLAFAVPFLIVASATFYLLVGAALALVEAETGGIASFRWKVGAAFAFLLLIIGAPFIHQRIRCLAKQANKADLVVDALPLERLVIERMASGHLSLELTEQPSWESFERYADELLRRLDGRVVERDTTVDMHLWSVEIETVPLRLVYKDFSNRVNLESDSYPGDMLIRKLRARLAPAAKP